MASNLDEGLDIRGNTLNQVKFGIQLF